MWRNTDINLKAEWWPGEWYKQNVIFLSIQKKLIPQTYYDTKLQQISSSETKQYKLMNQTKIHLCQLYIWVDLYYHKENNLLKWKWNWYWLQNCTCSKFLGVETDSVVVLHSFIVAVSGIYLQPYLQNFLSRETKPTGWAELQNGETAKVLSECLLHMDDNRIPKAALNYKLRGWRNLEYPRKWWVDQWSWNKQ